jgi:transcriptional regulator with XRE-family HTH domain
VPIALQVIITYVNNKLNSLEILMGVIVPGQLRAARALLGMSQEALAAAAGVGIGTVRDAEGERRSFETETVAELRRALENAGVSFVSGAADGGPGVRYVTGRPIIVKLPTTMTLWDGLPFKVEWQGAVYTVFLPRELLDDIAHFTGRQSHAAYVGVFEKHRGSILDGTARALEAGRADAGKLHLRDSDVSAQP